VFKSLAWLTWPRLYLLWACVSIALALSAGGFSAENITRLGVLAFLLFQGLTRSYWQKLFSGRKPQVRFILLGCLLAVGVEGFHMISMPVFAALKITAETTFFQGLGFYALDLLFTLPAYLLVFSLIWHLINRYAYGFWHYTLVMGLAQALGDGGLYFFIGAPALLLFLPYPMTNYHAINLLPYALVQEDLNPERKSNWRSNLAIVWVILAYFVCGAVIQGLGRVFGLVS